MNSNDDKTPPLDIRIPMLALGPVPGLASPLWAAFGRGGARLTERWARELAAVLAPYRWIARIGPDVELALTLPVTAARRVDAHRVAVRDGIAEAVRAGFAAGTGHPPARSQITVTITYDTATIAPHGDAALCMRKEFNREHQ